MAKFGGLFTLFKIAFEDLSVYFLINLFFIKLIDKLRNVKLNQYKDKDSVEAKIDFANI